MDSVAQPELTPILISTIKEALACGLFGVVISACVYGITVLQAYIYFRNNGDDSRQLRYFVALLFALDTISMVLTVSTYYEYFVTAFGNQALLFRTPTTFAFENGVTVIIGTLTQCFFAHRLWALSKRNVVLVGTIIVLALCSCGPGIAISINLQAHSDLYYLGSLETRILAGFANGLSVVCDIVIAASLTYYLHYKRTGFRRTDSKIDRLIIYAINRRVITAMCQAGHMITIIGFPGHYIFFVFGLLDGKLYCNTLLATLNAQKSMNREGNNVVELGTQEFKPNRIIHASTTEQSDPASADCMPSFVLDVTREKAAAHAKHGLDY